MNSSVPPSADDQRRLDLEAGLSIIRANERYVWRTGIALGVMIGVGATCVVGVLLWLLTRDGASCP